MKRPSFQFYPGDWLSVPELRACSVSARGVWIDMICLMHQGEPYGHLTINGKGILPGILARILGCTLEELERYLEELESAGVFSRTEDGVIFSRRMIRDEEIRQARASGGYKALEHPNVAKPKKGKAAEGYPSRVSSKPSSDGSSGQSFDPSPSSSSSSSSPSLKEEPTTKVVGQPRRKLETAPKRPPDPRASHVAVQACRQIAESYPPKEIWDKVIEILGDAPDLERLRACRAEWVERGFSKNSWKWATEWYRTGAPERVIANGPTAFNRKVTTQARGEDFKPVADRFKAGKVL